MPETDSDASANTARFQAFATRGEEDLPAPWQMRAGGSKVGILLGAVAVVVILGVILGVILTA